MTTGVVTRGGVDAVPGGGSGGPGPTIRVVDRPAGARPHRDKVVVSWSAPGRLPAEAESTFDLDIDDAVAERVRWYLEDYAEFPLDPAPEVAVTAENDLAGLGRGLFTAVFGTGDGARIWAQATVDGLSGVRVEIDADPAHAPGHPHIKHERALLTYIDARRCCFSAKGRGGDVVLSMLHGPSSTAYSSIACDGFSSSPR